MNKKYSELTEEQKEKKREYSRQYRIKNLEECRERERRYYAENRDKRLAYQRTIPKEVWQDKNQKFRDKTKYDLYEYYGNKCACCGETEMKFLSIDHVNGGGNKHRKNFCGGSSIGLMIEIKRRGYPPEFQLLCMNCNSGKYRNGGVCPHKERD